MPSVSLDPDTSLHYRDDDFADPWTPHETIVLLHGFAESGAVWYAWVPALARRLRVIRPDLRGFGRSSIPADAAAFPWSPERFAQDIDALLDRLGLESVHVVGARVGGAVGIQLAADHPERVKSLTLVSGVARGTRLRGLTAADGTRIPVADFSAHIRRGGVEAWMAGTGRSRLGSGVPEEQLRWWNEQMSMSDLEVCAAVIAAAPLIDLFDRLPAIQAPTLVLASEGSQAQTLADTRAWQELIPRSELQAMPGDSPHLAAERPDDCAARVLEFIARRCPS